MYIVLDGASLQRLRCFAVFFSFSWPDLLHCQFAVGPGELFGRAVLLAVLFSYILLYSDSG